MKIERTLVHEPFILDAILGARLSYGSGGKSDSLISSYGEFGDDVGYCLTIGNEDQKLLEKLILAGDGEDKCLRTIPVSVVITAPLKWWSELDTYKIGTVRQSSSLMHRLKSKGQFTEDDFETSDPESPRFKRMLNDLNEAWQEWEAANKGRHDKYPEWTEWQDLVPRSYCYTSHWTANYAVLRYIHKKRKHHRMKQWQQFCSWIESLPHSWLMTTEKAK